MDLKINDATIYETSSLDYFDPSRLILPAIEFIGYVSVNVEKPKVLPQSIWLVKKSNPVDVSTIALEKIIRVGEVVVT